MSLPALRVCMGMLLQLDAKALGILKREMLKARGLGKTSDSRRVEKETGTQVASLDSSARSITCIPFIEVTWRKLGSLDLTQQGASDFLLGLACC